MRDIRDYDTGDFVKRPPQVFFIVWIKAGGPFTNEAAARERVKELKHAGWVDVRLTQETTVLEDVKC